MKGFIRHIGKLFLLVVPLILGLIGFVWVEGLPLVQSLFNCVCMYCLNYQDVPTNLWIEIARWLAPLATASGVVLVVHHFKTSIRNALAYATRRSVAVFGPEEERGALLEELGRAGIALEQKLVKAHKYVLLGSEQENLQFYQLHAKRLQKRDVYIKCHTLPAQAATDPKLHLFCPEETAARYFWKTYCPYELSVQCKHQFQVTMIGFGKLGKELLLSALQNNIFHRDQKIQYHIIGQEEGFCSIYHQLHQLSDPVYFHGEPWYEQMELLRDSEMVVVADLSNPLAILRDLTLAFPGKPVHALATGQQGIDFLKAQNPCLHVFDWKACAYQKEAILGSVLYDQAMGINLRYAYLYNNVEENPENKLQQWALLDAFKRYSNISSADYHDIRKLMIQHNGWAVPLKAEQLEILAELEHVRWCRYHFLNNWQHGIPKNGEAKDSDKRIHRSLIPYGKLSEDEKEKDRQVIDILLSLSSAGSK